ncbi:MAG TPA: GNAT family N-acetyltransferase [Ktedonobacterales bacterium]|jgi:mycothiol synthase
MTAVLPDGLTIRAPTMDDAEAIAALANACRLAEGGTATLTAEEIRYAWQTAGSDFNLAANTWAVVTPEGKLVAYADLFQRGYVAFSMVGWTHPEYCGQGIGTYLLRLVEARAIQQIPAAPPRARISIKSVSISHKNDAARLLVEQEGYRLARHVWEMMIEMDSAPPASAWPEGMTIRTFIPDQDLHPVYAAIEEAFQDHWNHTPTPLEDWEQRVKRKGFDPTLWFLALDGKEIAGAALCRSDSGTALVGQLAVRRPWRRQGLGMALLRHAFGEFYRRGKHQVILTVDSQNPTGATRLYERAGMRVIWQYDTYEKELRPGTGCV